ncbi:hypothetical protein K0M31_001222 [Melipona bicolor]|uniref:Uncharacterized protein n=1 Tax=Melipona bicolor TaxID=60889 RepID=A0AA40GF89_9HYME|nr:hypothetical protein K0M31_001222 [Melipona bicolor]
MSTVERILRHGVQTVVRKPNAVINYTKFMGGVDLADQYYPTYCFMKLNSLVKSIFVGVQTKSVYTNSSDAFATIAKSQLMSEPLSEPQS